MNKKKRVEKSIQATMCFKTHLSNDDKPKAHALKKKEDGWTKNVA